MTIITRTLDPEHPDEGCACGCLGWSWNYLILYPHGPEAKRLCLGHLLALDQYFGVMVASPHAFIARFYDG